MANTTDSIRDAIAATSNHLVEHPKDAASTDSVTAVREGDLRFSVEGPAGKIVSDMTRAVGGAATAPSPGWLLRAALATCDATLVAMEAAREGIELDNLEVSVEGDSDFRGILGLDNAVHPGPLAIRVQFKLAAKNATKKQLREIVRRAESRSPVRDALAREVSMSTEIVA